ncbi:MAG: PQQ-like beta-propeller repeat protein, partial [Candidatus Coatesbacteria bacterium]|nr:PQQ-like beta-propeller repeat protein [Candidatus Coatesbacteria bacterium]
MRTLLLIMILQVTFLFSAPGDLLWRYKLDDLTVSSAFVVNNIAYIGCEDGYLYAIYANNGTLKWRYKTEGYGYTSSPCVSNGIVYFGTGAGEESNFYALNAENGTFIWKYRNYENIRSTPSVYNGIVYFNSDYIFALNAANGEEVWKYSSNYTWGSP